MMKKIKTLKILVSSFLACSAYASESTDVLFSVFGTEMRTSEMVERGFLRKGHLNCGTTYDASADEGSQFKRTAHDIYQLKLTAEVALFNLKIEQEEAKTKITLSTSKDPIIYDVSFNDSYGTCVDFSISCIEQLGGLSERDFAFSEDGIHGFRPGVHQSGDSLCIRAGLDVVSSRTIYHCNEGDSILTSANNIKNHNVIYSTSGDMIFEVRPTFGIAPVLRSMILNAKKESSPHFKASQYYNACLLSGSIGANATDISVCNSNLIVLNFDASIVDG
jgi:hypothetical protein